ncbi:MAG TPA: hypothetical protein VGS58_14480 [Candidatus Sulfopaludibacter sp.]|nr:hypothetical protein [Candidatus Sulfopaludibacter sp.]
MADPDHGMAVLQAVYRLRGRHSGVPLLGELAAELGDNPGITGRSVRRLEMSGLLCTTHGRVALTPRGEHAIGADIEFVRAGIVPVRDPLAQQVPVYVAVRRLVRR